MAEAKIAKAEEALSKKDKKEKKRKRKEESVTRDLESDDEETNEGDKEARREARKKDRQSRKKDKEDLKEKVPKVDEDGIAYTKIQTKRMIKRVKRGLPPVPTKHEENERLRNEAQLRREEEAELSGMIFGKEEDEEEDEEQAVKDEDDDSEGAGNDKADSDEEEKDESKFKKAQKENPAIQQNKKAKRSKTVPDDYVCSACKNKHQPIHWIYDCPNKVTIRGTNQKRKKLRGLHDPDSKKVFVSGLPFDVKPDDVEQLFKGCGTVASCKLIKFEDTGRCKGQAYVSFETDDSAKKAMKLSGTTIDNSKDEPKKKAKKSDTPAKARMQLKLKVTKVMNRWMMKNK